ncbi:hypothetical protein WISP_80000 [Willisornis vidua]|uniref:phosphatidate cytidylyltransferase n=1 Tax=Willisornis vidua TaxID=1566151 RepID=A0ABQ9D4T4_9PASS|nr:hypothetical protein WISP_80000 [Willisornis vidua]
MAEVRLRPGRGPGGARDPQDPQDPQDKESESENRLDGETASDSESKSELGGPSAVPTSDDTPEVLNRALSNLSSRYFLLCVNYFFYGETVTDYFFTLVQREEPLRILSKYHRFISFALYLTGCSNLAWDTSRNGAATASLGTLCQCCASSSFPPDV